MEKGFECRRVVPELLIDLGNKAIVTRHSFQYRAHFRIVFFVHLNTSSALHNAYFGSDCQ